MFPFNDRDIAFFLIGLFLVSAVLGGLVVWGIPKLWGLAHVAMCGGA